MFKRKDLSSFNGKICEIPGVYVDNFVNPSTDGAKVYFLSHYHSDHTVGLQEKELIDKLKNKNNVFIYATKITAAIIVHNNRHLEKYVKVLDSGSNLIVIPGDSEQNESETILSVTLIPAGHCLGSTMFLFETTSIKVLFTGDFRIRPNDLSKYAGFHEKNGEIIKLDVLYVDTTFLNLIDNLPKRSDSVEEALLLIKRVLGLNEDQHIVLKTPAKYGYEYVYNQIYKLLGLKVYVDDDKWEFYKTIQHLVPGVTNDETETRIFSYKTPRSVYRRQPKYIKFSAWRWSEWQEERTSVEKEGDTIYICFSTHCSRMELISFIEYLNPMKVVGFPVPYKVQNSPFKVPISGKLVLTPKKSPKKVPYPLSKSYCEDKKVDDTVMKQLFG